MKITSNFRSFKIANKKFPVFRRDRNVIFSTKKNKTPGNIFGKTTAGKFGNRFRASSKDFLQKFKIDGAVICPKTISKNRKQNYILSLRINALVGCRL